MTNKIIEFCFENGILLDKKALDFLIELKDEDKAINIIKKLNKKIINNSDLENSNLNRFLQEDMEEVDKKKDEKIINNKLNTIKNNKREVGVDNFINYFRNRFLQMSLEIQNKFNLDDLVSIGKIGEIKRSVGLVGMVYDKKIVKNGNMIFDIEDLTGKVKVFVNKENKMLFSKALDICLDGVFYFQGYGNREIVFVTDILFLDIENKIDFSGSGKVAFIGDLHFGGKGFMRENFMEFIKYLNNQKEIRYLFIVGDLISGIGNYPFQKQDLEIKDIYKQYEEIKKILKNIREDVNIIILPGNHEPVRLGEPQPIIDKDFLSIFSDMNNIKFVSNPYSIDIGGVNVFGYHGFSFSYYANSVAKIASKDKLNNPVKVVEYLLKVGHLAPSYGASQNLVLEKDKLVISKIPQIFVCGHSHKSGIGWHNGILIISVSSWEKYTQYQEKLGAIPDYCKVPVVDLHNGEVCVVDFEDIDNIKEFKIEENKDEY